MPIGSIIAKEKARFWRAFFVGQLEIAGKLAYPRCNARQLSQPDGGFRVVLGRRI